MTTVSRRKPLTQIQSSSESEDWIPIKAIAARDPKKIIAAYGRMMRKMMFVLAHMNRQKVIDKWTKDSTQSDARLEDQHAPKKRNPKSRMQRRTDLCYVGKALPRSQSSRIFPHLANACPHKNMMLATGGRSGTVAQHTWLCQGCGNRWQRVGETEATNGEGADLPPGQVIQPKIRVSKDALEPYSSLATQELQSEDQRDLQNDDDDMGGDEVEIIPQFKLQPKTLPK